MILGIYKNCANVDYNLISKIHVLKILLEYKN